MGKQWNYCKKGTDTKIVKAIEENIKIGKNPSEFLFCEQLALKKVLKKNHDII